MHCIMQYQCNYCQENIEDVRVKCSECKDFDLCLRCFSSGAEIGSHKNRHNYQLIDCGNFPIFNPPHDWKSKEELRLLENIEQFGFGNWSACAVDEERTADEIEKHYTDLYILGSIGRATWDIEQKHHIHDHTVMEGGPLSPSLSIPLPPLELTTQEQQELGYLPNRDDFEKEYDNEAESLTSNLVINNDDDEVDTALKLALISIYTTRLEERLKRKKIAREFGLVNQFFSSSNKQKSQNPRKKSFKDERELQERMQVFCRFQTAYEHEQLFRDLQREKELRLKIKELFKYRKTGLTKLQECAEFEMARYKKEKRKENGKVAVGFFVLRKLLMESKEREDEKGNTISAEKQKKDDTIESILVGRCFGLVQLCKIVMENVKNLSVRATG
ncbi:transcriptional adapter 2-beta-like [Centruroides vittatus]|uniref:transcriptional adapter 2-beta-like n=2 Tax=Centruroides TaxID=6875 RepID=UPI0035108457